MKGFLQQMQAARTLPAGVSGGLDSTGEGRLSRLLGRWVEAWANELNGKTNPETNRTYRPEDVAELSGGLVQPRTVESWWGD